MRELVVDLRAEQSELDALVSRLSVDDWRAPTPAVGWDIRDQIAHLADIDELGLACVRGEADDRLAALARMDPAEATRAGCDRGAGLGPEEMLEWWRTARAALNDAFRSADPSARIPWGAGPMAIPSFVAARLMECWAHGLDCFAAVGVQPVDSDRLAHVCRIGYRALPYAFRYADRDLPADLSELRLELVAPGGSTWQFGEPDAPQQITGSAGEWARVAVQRMPLTDASSLRSQGALAEAALEVARAYV